jgi:membrane dipeptidase
LQVLPLFSPTISGSSLKAQKELFHYKNLLTKYSDHFIPFSYKDPSPQGKIAIYLAIENASCFAEEDEPLSKSLERLEKIIAETPLFYITLTWKSENRFGGGNETKIGLKPDGKVLLDFLHGRKIAVDLSHTSDSFASDILSYIDKKGLKIPLIASHSNVRSVQNHPRNLPEEFVKEIIRRKGLIGFNLIRDFVGKDISCLASHLEAVLLEGGEDVVCFGVDFFFDGIDCPVEGKEHFFPEAPNASCYPSILELLQKKLNLSEKLTLKLSLGNVQNYLQGIFSK